jgi:hypothetical protein
MPAWEVMAWAVFEGEFGPLSLHQRMDWLIAQQTWAVFAAAGGKDFRGKVDDFVPDWRPPVRWESDTDWLKIMAARGGL